MWFRFLRFYNFWDCNKGNGELWVWFELGAVLGLRGNMEITDFGSELHHCHETTAASHGPYTSIHRLT